MHPTFFFFRSSARRTQKQNVRFFRIAGHKTHFVKSDIAHTDYYTKQAKSRVWPVDFGLDFWNGLKAMLGTQTLSDDMFAERVLTILKEASNKKENRKPFLLFYAVQAPHDAKVSIDTVYDSGRCDLSENSGSLPRTLLCGIFFLLFINM